MKNEIEIYGEEEKRKRIEGERMEVEESERM
jgi:hypothetical protein